MAQNTITDEENMGDNEDDKYRRESGNRFFDASQIENDKAHNQKNHKEQLVLLKCYGQKAEKGIAAGDERHGNGQHIIYEKRAAGNNTCVFIDRMSGNDITAAAMREVFYDAAI